MVASSRQFFTMSLAVASIVSGCDHGGPQGGPGDGVEFSQASLSAGYVIPGSNLTDWYACGKDYSTTCTAGSGGKFMAYGANGQFVFQDVPEGPVLCLPSTFRNIDPIQNVVKTCYMSSLTLIARMGETVTPANSGTGAKGTMTIAWGGDGIFSFPFPGQQDAGDTVVCTTAAFGPLPRGVARNPGCYQSLTGYHVVASEHASMTVGNNAPIAMGENGTFAYTRKSGTFVCDWPSLFGYDPMPGVVKSCYVLDASSNNSPVYQNAYFGTNFGAAYTTGYWGNVIVKQLVFDGNTHGFYCNNGTFGGDPEPGQQTRFCFPTSSVIY
jgi:hypothetical protein